jgi:hypothetical protein
MKDYKQALKDSINKLEAKPVLSEVEQQALSELYDKIETHKNYLNESGMAYEY